jgi:hypothetical protein
MKKFILLFCIIISGFSFKALAQSNKGKVLLSAGLDAYRTDHRRAFEKYQFGLEANFFAGRNVALSVGYEHRTMGADALALGYRAYFLQPVFLRVKPLIYLDNSRIIDLNMGVGYNHYLNNTVSLEFSGDYYFRNSLAALRVAITGLF